MISRGPPVLGGVYSEVLDLVVAVAVAVVASVSDSRQSLTERIRAVSAVVRTVLPTIRKAFCSNLGRHMSSMLMHTVLRTDLFLAAG